MALQTPPTTHPLTDSLITGAEVALTPVDSVEMGVVESIATSEGSLEELFGQGAALAEQTVVEPSLWVHLTDNWVVSLLLVATFIYYCFVMWAYGGHIGNMAKVVFGGGFGTRVAEEVSYLFMRAVRNLVAVGILAWSLVAIKWIEVLGGEEPILQQSLLLVPGAIAVALVVGTAQHWATSGILHLVGRRQMSESMSIVSSTTMALTATIATPLALLFVLNSAESQAMIGKICIAIALLGLIIFCIKSLIFFIEQKISILLWFLYLCTVILIPIGVVARIVAGSGII